MFRGLGTLYQALKLGGRALQVLRQRRAGRSRSTDSTRKPTKEIPGWALAAPIMFSLAFFIFAYKFLPLFLVTKLSDVYPVLEGRIAFNSRGRPDPPGHPAHAARRPFA